jgi:hypothetical protein
MKLLSASYSNPFFFRGFQAGNLKGYVFTHTPGVGLKKRRLIKMTRQKIRGTYHRHTIQ